MSPFRSQPFPPTGRKREIGVKHRGRRQGLTLLEVVVAMGIFLIGVIGLYQLIQNASYRAIHVEQKSQASLRCQSKLAETLIGFLPMETSQFQPFSDDPQWQWRIQADLMVDGLYLVTVEVKKDLPNGESIKADLSQYALNPYIRGSSLDEPPSMEAPPPLEAAPKTETTPAEENPGGSTAPATPSPTPGGTAPTGGGTSPMGMGTPPAGTGTSPMGTPGSGGKK